MKLNHLSTSKIAKSELFFDIEDFGDFVGRVKKYGRDAAKSIEDKDSEEYKNAYTDAVGEAYEVYTEFFTKRYDSDPLLGIKDVEDTSNNKYQPGYDFKYKTLLEESGRLQSKFRGNPLDTFKMKDLGTFITMCDAENVPPNRRILFTNLSERSPFHYSYSFAAERMGVLGRETQEIRIKRDPNFWKDFSYSLKKSLIPRSNFKIIPESRDYQKDMEDKADLLFGSKTENRGRFICATGGGKSLAQYNVIQKGYKRFNYKLQIVVSPTIALAQQHYKLYENYGIFHKDKVKPVEFMTGDEARTDREIEYFKTTTVKELIENLAGKTLVFTTYASIQKLVDGLKSENIDHICFDEFQNLIIQDKEQKAFIENLPGKITLWSASIKRGRIVSALDEKLFGKLLTDITFKLLRERGIVVPIKILPIFIDYTTESLSPISRILRQSATDKGFDAKEAILETAAVEVVHKFMMDTYGVCNLITFSKQVAICEEIFNNEEIRKKYFDSTDMHLVIAKTPSREREKSFDSIKSSGNSVLLQHSVCSAGIDIVGFNSSLVLRCLETITLQQGPLGRICRAHPIDTENLKLGKISIDSPDGWIKPFGIMFVLVDNRDAENYKNFLKDFLYKLQEFGLSEDDYQFIDIREERNGKSAETNAWMAPLVTLPSILDCKNIDDAIKKAKLEMENELHEEELQRESDLLDDVPLSDLL